MNSEEAGNYRKFQKGTFLVKGWEARMKEILAAVPEQDRPQMQRFVEDLGEKIGKEWARDKQARKIDTAMLQRWGAELKEAKKAGGNRLKEKLKEIDDEVDRVLS